MDTAYKTLKYIETVNKINSNAKIVAVTKNTDVELINIAVKNGITILGENRVQEFLGKFEQYDTNNVHFIGHLQSNKVKYIIDKVSMIQSVDSLKLASVINDLALKNNKTMDILVEINIGQEISKSGININNVDELICEINQLKNLNLRGIMCIPPRVDILELERCFDKMHEKYTSYKDFDTLSMGMTGDFEIALKHGANMVRIGSGLFKT